MSGRGKNEETKRVKKVNQKNTKAKKTRKKHPKIATAIKIGLVVLMLVVIIGAGILVGTFFGVFGEELKISEEDLVIKFQNSTVYDKDGNEIATLSGGTKRKIVSMNEMNEYLPKAFVAIEDERFYTHRGVDFKRTLAATLTFITHAGNSSFGGSTITQQLVKNITTEDDDTGISGVLRKIKEMSKAIQVEQYLSKDQILELYLNIIFMGGGDINGVALGSIYYFDKDVKDLSIAECAFIAGINNSPNKYNPFKDFDDAKKDLINKRTKTVINKMQELGYINEEQKIAAKEEVDNGLPFKKGEGANVTVDISYHTEAAIEQIIDQLLEKNKDWNKDTAELYLYSNGLKIYTTQDTSIQAKLEEELVKEKYIQHKEIKDQKTKEVKETKDAIPTMVIVDHKTGQVVACATATGNGENRTTSTKLGYMNWPTKLKKQTGSTMKPIAVVAPGIETNKITAATSYLDCETRFAGMDKSMKNDDSYSNTVMSIRTGIALSKNIINAKAFMDIGVDTSMEFCKKMGITNLKDEGVSLALGGLNEGISPTHMAMAYATIANDGVYNSPTFYTKVTDENDKVVLEPEQKQEQVLSKQSAYIEKSILTQPVISGTARYCKIQGIETCAKTGTTNNSYDRWLCGFTPYYTAACWYGYEVSTEVTGFGRSNPAGQIWSNVMKAVHEELPNAEFEEPDGIVRATICSLTGKSAVPGQCTETYSEVFKKGTVPDPCDGHSALPICVETGLISGGPCPTELRNFMSLPERELNNNKKWTNVNTGTFTAPPTETCTLHGGGPATTPDPSQVNPNNQNNSNNTNQEHAHDWKSIRHDEATCTSPAKWVYQCAVCGATKDEPSGGPKGHTPKNTTTPATCSTPGANITSCAVCGAEISRSPIPATGAHNYQGGKCVTCGAADPNYKPPETPVAPTT